MRLIESGDPLVESVRRLPAPRLRSAIAFYSGYRQVGLKPGIHRGLPSPYLTMIVTLDEPLSVAAHADRRQAPDRYEVLLGGLHTSPALIAHDGQQSGIQLAINPLAARGLFGFPAAELMGIDLHASDVLGSLAVEMHDRIAHALGWAERFAVIDDVLLRRLEEQVGPRPEVSYVWQALVRSGGAASVPALAREAGWSSRYLRQQFRSEVGLTPKEAARVVRFDRARRRLERPQGDRRQPVLAELAAASGYYDQAHLDRDFREFAGCSPSRWLVEEFRNFQDEDVALVPD
jgi:AraC-like DNA-binding protein